MDKNTLAHYNAFDRGRNYMVKYGTLLNDIILYPASKTSFDNNMTDFEHAILAQTVETGMVAEDKDVIKLITGRTVITKFLHRACVQAHQLGLNQLEIAMMFPLSYITQAADKTALARAEDLRQLLKDNKGTLTVITDPDIDEIDLAITKLAEVINLPKTRIEEKKSKGTDQFLPIIHKLVVEVDMIGKLIKSYLPELVTGWVNTTKIGEVMKRHTSIVVKFTDLETGVPVVKVKVTFTKGSLVVTKVSTKKGYVRVLSMEVGNWDMKAENSLYNIVTISNIGIDDGHIERREVKMVKV
jgi:hypothetical protein